LVSLLSDCMTDVRYDMTHCPASWGRGSESGFGKVFGHKPGRPELSA
jgi:hypothetical protein